MYTNAVGKALATSGSSAGTVANAGIGKTTYGTSKNEALYGTSSDTLAGGGGDDTYTLWSATTKVVESAGQGTDTVIANYWGAATLSANVENLVLGSAGSTAGTGNALDNTITAGKAGALLNGLGGNDVLIGGAGADIYEVAKGNGSDRIIGFEPGHDLVKLDGYGYTSFAQLMSHATQTGSDVSIQLSGSEKLLLSNVNLSQLHGYDFGFAMATPTVPAGDTLMDGTTRGYNANGWYVLNNAWGAAGLKAGTDYTVTSVFNKADMTSGVTFTWSAPSTTALAPAVIAYPDLSFGVPPNGAYASDPTDKAAVFPVKVSDLVSATMNYDVAFSGNTAGFNVAYDIWFTNKPNGNASAVSNEVMVWLHTGTSQPFGSLVGTYQDGDFSAKIYHQGTYTAIVADHDTPAGTLDLTNIIAKLEDMGIMHGSEYLAAVDLGAEVTGGTGQLTVNNLDLEVDSHTADGGTVEKTVTGSGTTVHTVKPQLVAQPVATAVTDAHGVAVGAETITAANGVTTARYVDTSGKLLHYDTSTTGADGTITMRHYDSAGTFTGSDVTRTIASGQTSTQHLDANGTLLGTEKIAVNANGTTVTADYSASGALIGSTSVSTDASGRVTTLHYDSAWKFTGEDARVTEANGTVSVQHYNASFGFTGQDSTVIGSDGSATTYHYDSKWSLTEIDVTRAASNGAVTTNSYDSSWHLLASDYHGSAQGDTITGQTYFSNTIEGGLGSDTLKGGLAADTFVFDTAIGTGDVDKIIGFTTSQDTIRLDQSVFAGLSAPGALDPSAFVNGTVAHDANDRILYDQATGNLFYDADGSGSAHAVLFATVQADHALTAANFQIVV